MDLPQNHDMRTTGHARRDAVAWVLHSPLRGEALLLVGRIREEWGDARTGSFRTFVLTPFQNEPIARDRVDEGATAWLGVGVELGARGSGGQGEYLDDGGRQDGGSKRRIEGSPS